jgi:chemotaxis protein histidine kinase CheA
VSNEQNAMMLELFRAEVESHSNALTSGLLKLEQDPTNVKGIDGLMRAAHSIKGAARIVQVAPAVEVAHVMEDCFVAAQRGLLTLQSDAIDVMLGSVDVLTAIADESKNESTDWHSFEAKVQSIVLKLRAVLAGESIAVSPSISASNLYEQKDAHKLPKLPPPDSIAKPPSVRIAMPPFLSAHEAELARQRGMSLSTFDRQSKTLVLDLAATQDFDAIGLAFLHALAHDWQHSGDRLHLANASSDMKSALLAIGIGTSILDAGSGTGTG